LRVKNLKRLISWLLNTKTSDMTLNTFPDGMVPMTVMGVMTTVGKTLTIAVTLVTPPNQKMKLRLQE
jgi:hypothetical protein